MYSGLPLHTNLWLVRLQFSTPYFQTTCIPMITIRSRQGLIEKDNRYKTQQH